MSVFVGSVKGPHHNSPNDAADVWCSPGHVELRVLDSAPNFDPIAARNLAALLVRASEEAERMAACREVEQSPIERPE